MVMDGERDGERLSVCLTAFTGNSDYTSSAPPQSSMLLTCSLRGRGTTKQVQWLL